MEKKEEEENFWANVALKKWHEAQKKEEENDFWDPVLERFYKPQRQGRSMECRAKKEAELKKEKETADQKPYSKPYDYRCINCRQQELITDGGINICSNCGAEQEKIGFGVSNNDDHLLEGTLEQDHLPPIPMFNKYRGYQREVHYAVRIRQFMTLDPVLHPKLISILMEFIWEGKTIAKKELIDQLGPIEFWGPKSFRWIFNQPYWKEIFLKEPGWGGKRVCQHWIQIRKRLEIFPYQVDLDPNVLFYMNNRYWWIAKAFVALKEKHGRRNIYNLNYIIAQLLRMEAEDNDFKVLGKFLPQALSNKQPAENNRRWEEIIGWCQKNATYRNDDKVCLKFKWKYQPITEDEMKNIFGYFK
jgi:hypothetical protein